jgi:hypothetical protein
MKYQQPYGELDPDAPYVNGNPSTGTEGSVPPAASIEHPQREIVNLITNAGLAASEADLEQLTKAVRSQTLNYLEDAGTANALVVTPDPAVVLVAGLPLRVKKAGSDSTTTTPTITVGANAAKTIVDAQGNALSGIGDLPAGSMLELVYDGAAFRLVGGFKLVTANGLEKAAFPQQQRYYVPGLHTHVVAAGVRKVRLHVYGGGGGGGTGHATFVGGAGGGSGGYCRKDLVVTPGESLTITVGAGGAGGPVGTTTAGDDGGTSSVSTVGAGVVASATGGGGGEAGIDPIPGTPASSTPGVGAGGEVNSTGSYGSSGASGTNTNGEYTGYGGAGGNAPGPEGGGGGMMSTGSSGDGAFPGGAGSGGGSATGTNARGGDGADGLVIVEWVG